MFTARDRALLHLIARKLDLDVEIGLAGLAMEFENMATLAELTAQAEKTEGTIDSAIVVINGIADRIAAAGTDPAALQAVIDGLKGRSEALAFSIDADAHGKAPVVPADVPN